MRSSSTLKKFECIKPVNVRHADNLTSSCSSINEFIMISFINDLIDSLTKNKLNMPKLCNICTAASLECQLLNLITF